MTIAHITQSELKEMFDYCEKTGNLIWKIKSGKGYIGNTLGTVVTNGQGYYRMQTHLKGKMYKVHRLVWLWHYGTLPKMIDHIDNDALNNRIENLRECTASQNNQNRKFNGNITNFRGVTIQNSKYGSYYKAQIRINKKQKHLGLFKTPEEAHEAYKKAAIERDNFYKF